MSPFAFDAVTRADLESLTSPLVMDKLERCARAYLVLVEMGRSRPALPDEHGGDRVLPRRGRPRGTGAYADRALVCVLARVMEEHGFTVSGYRDGRAAKVFRLVFGALDRGVGEWKHHATRAKHVLEEMHLEQAREVLFYASSIETRAGRRLTVEELFAAARAIVRGGLAPWPPDWWLFSLSSQL